MSLQDGRLKQPEPPPQMGAGKKGDGEVCASVLVCCACPCTCPPCAPQVLSASPGSSNLLSVITSYKHDNLDPNASRRLQSRVLWTCYEGPHNLLMPTIKKGS